MFCLWRIYAGPIKDALDRHCRAMRVMAKRGNRTRNPFFPKGVHSPYDLMMEDHHGKDLTDDLIATINEEVGKFWGDASDQGDSDDEENRRRDEGPAAFDDPLPTADSATAVGARAAISPAQHPANNLPRPVPRVPSDHIGADAVVCA